MNFSLSSKAKEAIKIALAMVLVYGFALKLNWLNPSWAGLAVAMISLAPAGQSIRKGLLRIAGTFPGCLVALIILSLASQNRWFFVTLASMWIFLTTYLMIADKERSYMWNVAGFVCLIILLSGPSSSENIFNHAVFRSLDTVMGVLVYTLVYVFLWPQSNAGAVKKASTQLLETQARLVNAGRDIMIGKGDKSALAELRSQEVQQLEKFAAALRAKGSESYELTRSKTVWNRFHSLSWALMGAIDSWGMGFTQLSEIDTDSILPDLPAFFAELDNRFEKIQSLLGSTSPCEGKYQAHKVLLSIDDSSLQVLNPLDRAALVVARKDLENIAELTGSLLECASGLVGNGVDTDQAGVAPPNRQKIPGFTLPVLDLDHLKGATFAAVAVLVGFLVWIFINPPGHAGWFELSGIVAMAMAASQQFRPIVLIKPLALASLLCLGAYVFIMPLLSTFAELGSLIFILMFINCYFFAGLARLAGMIAIINEISVSNPQSYNFAAMANSLVFIIMVFIFLFAMSYLLGASRPEKVLLKLTKRYFHSARYLVQRHISPDSGEYPRFQTWQESFHRYEIKTLPGKIAAWGRAIDQQLFPANSQAQVQALVTSLGILSVRLEKLLDTSGGGREHELVIKASEVLLPWLAKIQAVFVKLSEHPESTAGKSKTLQNHLSESLADLEGRINRILQPVAASALNEADGEYYYQLLGGLRGVSEACVAYAGVAGDIDWSQWSEEKFS